MIGRRTFSAGMAALAADAAHPALAQPARRLPVAALVLGSTPLSAMVGPEPAVPVRYFIQGLNELGWIDDRTVAVERRTADGDPSRAPLIFADLASRRVDVIAIGGERWLVDAALAATRSIPIVANMVYDPVAAGLVASLARPGGNLTGVTESTGPDFDAKRLQLLRELAPGLSRIAYIASSHRLAQFASAQVASGITVIPAPANVPGEVDDALAIAVAERADGLIVANDGPTFFAFRRIAAFAAERRLPAIFGIRDAIDAGGLMSYGPPFRFRQIGRMAARFLQGAKLGEVPIEQPTNFSLVINAKAARALGFEIPPALAAQADEVIE